MDYKVISPTEYYGQTYLSSQNNQHQYQIQTNQLNNNISGINPNHLSILSGGHQQFQNFQNKNKNYIYQNQVIHFDYFFFKFKAYFKSI